MCPLPVSVCPKRTEACPTRMPAWQTRLICQIFHVPSILHFDPSVDALSLRSDVMCSIKTLAFCRGQDWKRDSLPSLRTRSTHVGLHPRFMQTRVRVQHPFQCVQPSCRRAQHSCEHLEHSCKRVQHALSAKSFRSRRSFIWNPLWVPEVDGPTS